jgi:glyoxylase-like metal-dependent hydrolase (beta-lactamase superfamily II)
MGKTTWHTEVLLQGSWRGATSVLISNGDLRIVVDTGMPHEGHLLLSALQRKGLNPADIKTLVNTHFHIDHVLNNNLFPSAEIYASQQSHDWSQSLYSDMVDDQSWEKLTLKYYPEMYDYDRSRQHMAKLRKLALRWWDLRRLGKPEQFKWLEANSLPEGIETLITSGHVPGHVSLLIRSEEQATIIAGDALLSREHEEQVATMIPHNRAQFLEDRTRILNVGGRILPGHDAAFSANSKSHDADPGY